MKRNTQEAAPCSAQSAYKFNGVTYVPHYRNHSVYVGPGYPKHNRTRYSADELVLAGAALITELLWVRSNHGIVNEINP